MENVVLKGNKDGLIVHVNNCSYKEIKSELIGKIERGKDFFKSCKMYIVDKENNLHDEELEDLKKVLKERYDIIIDVIISERSEIEKKDKPFNADELPTKFIQNTVRSGQDISFEGNIVIIGDVNSGSQVIAEGNIVVLGALRGVAFAGSKGNVEAIVAAYRLQPALLRIAGLIARAPDDNNDKPTIPEVARIRDNMIAVEPYLPNKFVNN